MPIYRYKCSKTGTEFSELWLNKEEALQNEESTPCPVCQERAVRIMGRVAVKFEGEGWTPKGTP